MEKVYTQMVRLTRVAMGIGYTSICQLAVGAFGTGRQTLVDTERKAFLPILGPHPQFPEIPLEYIYRPLWIRCQLSTGIV